MLLAPRDLPDHRPGNIAAARDITLTEARSTVTGGIELNGILGLDGNVRNGYQNMTITFNVKGDARRRSRGRS